MKVKIEIRQTRFFYGEKEMTEEEYCLFKNGTITEIINAMMLKGLEKDEDNWELITFIKSEE